MRKSANDSEIQSRFVYIRVNSRPHIPWCSLAISRLFKIHAPDRFIHFSTPIQAMIRRYGAPTTSSIVGSHHTLFSQGKGLTKQPAAPRHAPTMEMVAAGFLRLIHEQTVILLTAITPADIPNRNHAMSQRKGNPISSRERALSEFLLWNPREWGESSWRILEELSH
jgi:hypothetical protein